jgi:type IV pilus assembly protein PilM
MAFGPQAAVGLDIGTSAVRAAQVGGGRGSSSLTAFAQVPLPRGAVVDGEIRDPDAVSGAIEQLWKRAKIRSKRAVIGIANQRVVVRQVDLPYLEEKDFRGALKFQVADHIPMSVEDAELDFEIIEDFQTESGEHLMRVLLIAAATDMVDAFVSVVANGGLEPAGVDLTSFAVARAVSPAARGETGAPGAQAVIDVGAGVTDIVVHVGGEPRFVRILLVGGDDVTQTLSTDLGLSFEQSEALKLDLGRGAGSAEAGRILSARVDSLVDEIRSSLDYYASQGDSFPISSVIVAGGGSLTPGLMGKLEQTLRREVRRATPLSQMNYSKSGLTPEQAAQVESVAAASIGLAIGTTKR